MKTQAHGSCGWDCAVSVVRIYRLVKTTLESASGVNVKKHMKHSSHPGFKERDDTDIWK